MQRPTSQMSQSVRMAQSAQSAQSVSSASGNDEMTWLRNLQVFIYKTLEPIIADPVKRQQYVDSKAMPIWAKAFTHETYSLDNNYEELEYLGDAILKSVFPTYLKYRFPALKKNELSELNIAYMSKMEQAALAHRMNLGPHVRTRGLAYTILNLETDVFESFIGALYEVSDNINRGTGFLICYNMIVYLFKNVEIDMAKSKGSSITQVEQLFTRFELGKPGEIVTTDNNTVRIVVELSPQQLTFLAQYGVQLEKYIGEGFGSTKTEAKNNAYDQALNVLSSRGITPEWAANAKKYNDFHSETVAPLYDALMAKSTAEGYSELYFFIPRKTTTKTGVVAELIGVKGGKSEVLAVDFFSDPNDRKNAFAIAKGKLVQKYLQS